MPRISWTANICWGFLTLPGFSPRDEIEEADVVLINTCGFLQSAVEESIDTILETAKLKRTGNLKRLVVAGCFVQRYGYKLLREIPEVDAWVGTGEIDRVAEAVSKAGSGTTPFLDNEANPPSRSSGAQDPHNPFLYRLSQDRRGMLPSLLLLHHPESEGGFSKPRYGIPASGSPRDGVGRRKRDQSHRAGYQLLRERLKNGPFLEDLLEKMIDLDGVAWIRLLYLHPQGITERLLDLMESQERIAPYLDLPLQHTDSHILRAMGRDPDRERPRELIARIRAKKREMSIRTTLMVGFPGETETMFEQMLEFIEWAEFEHLGVFVYSPEKGTPAARLKPVVAPDIAERTACATYGRPGSHLQKKEPEDGGEGFPCSHGRPLPRNRPASLRKNGRNGAGGGPPGIDQRRSGSSR